MRFIETSVLYAVAVGVVLQQFFKAESVVMEVKQCIIAVALLPLYLLRWVYYDSPWARTFFGYKSDPRAICMVKDTDVGGFIRTWTLHWHSLLSPKTRWLGFYLKIDAYPDRSFQVGFCLPFILGLHFRMGLSKGMWQWLGFHLKPASDLIYGFCLNDTFVSWTKGNLMSPGSWEINFREKLRKIIHNEQSGVIEDGGWYDAFVPLEPAGDFEKEKIRLRCRKIILEQRRRDWLKVTRHQRVLYTFDLKDGIVIPSEANVYEDQVLTGTTIQGPRSHPEAIGQLLDAITKSRKRRPKTKQ